MRSVEIPVPAHADNLPLVTWLNINQFVDVKINTREIHSQDATQHQLLRLLMKLDIPVTHPHAALTLNVVKEMVLAHVVAYQNTLVIHMLNADLNAF